MVNQTKNPKIILELEPDENSEQDWTDFVDDVLRDFKRLKELPRFRYWQRYIKKGR